MSDRRELDAEIAEARADPKRAVGRFLLLEQLGRGGMGVVWRAWDPELGRVVALKMLLEEHGDDEAAVERLAREAEAIARLRHPNVVTVHEAGVHQRRPFLVMELVDGQTFEKLLAKDALTLDRIVAIVADCARALDAAHARGILHRDVKPANVMIDRDGRTVLMDFGLARLADRKTRLTASGTAVGTPDYMAPEQVDSSGEIDARADVWGLGATLYHAITKRPPFHGTSVHQVLAAIVRKPPVAPRKIDPKIPVGLEAVCLRCLAKRRDERYSTAGELAEDLERLGRGDTVSQSTTSSVQRALARSTRRQTIAAIALALATLALGAVALVAAKTPPEVREAKSEGPPPPPRRSPSVSPSVEKARETPIPDWFSRLPRDLRPPWPLPGLELGDAEGEYVNVKDRSVLVFVPAGKFMMGSTASDGEESSKPVHEVELSSYFIGKYELTTGRFAKFVAATGYVTESERGLATAPEKREEVETWRRPARPEDHPVVHVTWNDASAYCRWAGLRLPTEAQWERAAVWDAKAGRARAYPWGDDELGPRSPIRANVADRSAHAKLPAIEIVPGYDDGFATTAPVGTFPLGASPCGALDMIGNAGEWCEDDFDLAFYNRSPRRDPVADRHDRSDCRVYRDCGFIAQGPTLRATHRNYAAPQTPFANVGFRVARGP